MENARIQRLLNVFADMGHIYRTHYSDPLWGKYPDVLSDRVQSLAVFLDGYAFERAGRAPKYSETATRIVASKKLEDLDPMSIWREFWDKFGEKGVNSKVNPLAPKGTKFGHKGTTRSTAKISAVELDRLLEKPLVQWVVDNLPNTPQTAHNRLREISGVGEKIASFFMRDVACQFNVFPLQAQERRLLQPVDIWVERSATCLGAASGEAADFVVRCSGTEGNRPERVNQGMWFFGAEIVRSEKTLKTFVCETTGNDQVTKELNEQVALLQEVLKCLESKLGDEDDAGR